MELRRDQTILSMNDNIINEDMISYGDTEELNYEKTQSIQINDNSAHLPHVEGSNKEDEANDLPMFIDSNSIALPLWLTQKSKEESEKSDDFIKQSASGSEA